MSNKKGFSLAAIIMGCSALAAGTAFAAANSSTDRPAQSDVRITHEVQQKLQRDLPNDLRNVQIETKDGVVTLTGRADTGLAKLKALQDARQVRGVTDVKDHLNIQM